MYPLCDCVPNIKFNLKINPNCAFNTYNRQSNIYLLADVDEREKLSSFGDDAKDVEVLKESFD